MQAADITFVSPEMSTVVGQGTIGEYAFPSDSALLVFAFGGVGMAATLRIVAASDNESIGDAEEGPDSLSIVVQRAALDRLFGWSPAGADGARFHLTSELRAIAVALRDCPMEGPAREPYRLAKSIELLCETARLLVSGALVPVAPEGAMSLADSRRLVDARRIIDERWSEKLTLDGLARACGINRAKLTRGFRDLYRCSIAEALAERRLGEASRRLLTTDLPVSKIGYDSGYLNNASFARAFGRRFGVSPSEYRGRRLAA
jgi:AraC family transcriptional activator of pyochelin receptor